MLVSLQKIVTSATMILIKNVFIWAFLVTSCASEMPTTNLKETSSILKTVNAESLVVHFAPSTIDGKPKSFVANLVSLFASRFKEMSTYFNHEEIFEAVATHNINVAHNGMRPIQIFAKLALQTDHQSYRNELIANAAKANEIYNQTVTCIIFTISDPDVVDNWHETIKTMRLRENNFRFGIEVDDNTCQFEDDMSMLILYQTLDIVIIRFPWHYSFVADGVKDTIQYIKGIFAKCKSLITSRNSFVEVAISTTWPDRDIVGTWQNQSAMVDFWQQMASLSKSLNVRIFLEQAFDDSFSYHDNIVSNGWWTADLVEKAAEPNNRISSYIDDQTKISVCNHKSPEAILKYNATKTATVNFNTDLVTVFFEEDQRNWGYIGSPPFTGTQEAALVEIISQRFTHVLLGVQEDTELVESRTGLEFLRGVALRNKAASHCHGENFRMVKITVGTWFQNFAFDLGRPNDNMALLLKSASGINEIFENTVTRILVFFPYYKKEQFPWENVTEVLKINLEKARALNMTIGVVLRLDHVDDKDFVYNITRYVHPHVDFVFLKFDICLFGLPENVQEILQFVFDTNRKSYIRFQNNTQENIMPGIFLKILGNRCISQNASHSDFGRFWLDAGKFAEERKVPLIIGPGISELNKYSGEWWKLVGTGLNYALIEPDSEVTNLTPSNGLSYGLTIGGPVFLVVFVAGATFAFFHVKRRNRRTEDSKLFDIVEAEFIQGRGAPSLTGTDLTRIIIQDLARMAYDSAYEIDKKCFSIDSSIIMGSGTFGTVCLAKIVKNHKTDWTAAKVLQCNDPNQTASLRSLLIEIKILSYLGKHQNVIHLVGAYTAEISSGNIYAFLELCHLGSLHSYLRQKPQSQQIKSHLERDCPSFSDTVQPPTHQEMLNWSIDISRGMQYISSKHIVHADLATRNVLLDVNKTAKICDFGLSRRMENYSNYVKTKREPLPWRWMAFESLTHMEFSTKSDVWSYGITLWEIYNEGQVPYQGLSWTWYFADALKSGLRPPQTKRICETMYSLMSSCWSIDPERRPDFAAITETLNTDTFKPTVSLNGDEERCIRKLGRDNRSTEELEIITEMGLEDGSDMTQRSVDQEPVYTELYE